jgi:hypothetical protein
MLKVKYSVHIQVYLYRLVKLNCDLPTYICAVQCPSNGQGGSSDVLNLVWYNKSPCYPKFVKSGLEF